MRSNAYDPTVLPTPNVYRTDESGYHTNHTTRVKVDVLEDNDDFITPKLHDAVKRDEDKPEEDEAYGFDLPTPCEDDHKKMSEVELEEVFSAALETSSAEEVQAVAYEQARNAAVKDS